MARCDVCGNEYDKAFVVSRDGKTMTFDSFECAIRAMAPVCPQCDCKVIGHGVEANGVVFCCAHCARRAGIQNITDRSDNVRSPSALVEGGSDTNFTEETQI